MASGFEVLGALAGASQLAEQILRIGKFVQNVKDGPKEVLDHVASLQQLASVAASIKSNPSYQSQQVAEILAVINTKAKAVMDILNDVRTDPADKRQIAIRKAFIAIWKDASITNKLDQIERDKTTLALCLAQIDG